MCTTHPEVINPDRRAFIKGQGVAMLNRSLPFLLGGWAALFVSPALVSSAWADQAACQAIEDALVKMAATPVHETITVERAPTTLKSETIRTADTMYIEV